MADEGKKDKVGLKKEKCPACDDKEVVNLGRHLRGYHRISHSYTKEILRGRATRGDVNIATHVQKKSRKSNSMVCPVCKQHVAWLHKHIYRAHHDLSKKDRMALVKRAKIQRELESEEEEEEEKESERGSVEDAEEAEEKEERGLEKAKRRKLEKRQSKQKGEDDRRNGDKRDDKRDDKREREGKKKGGKAKQKTTPVQMAPGSEDLFTNSDWTESDKSSDTDDEEDPAVEKRKFKGLMDSWEAWLATPEGGSVDQRVLNDHASRLQVMAAWLMYSRQAYVSRRTVNNMFQKMPEERKQTPGTVLAYIATYTSFLNFLFLEKEIPASSKQRAEACLLSIRKTVYKKASIRKFELLEKETTEAISNEDIHKFQTSKWVQEVRHELLLRDREEPVSREVYNKCRNYLLTEIALYNRHRPAPIVNITIEKFLTARPHVDDENKTIRTISVSETKTYATHGGAVIAFSEDLYQNIMFFIGEIRANIPGMGVEHVGGPVFLMYDTLEGVSSSRHARMMSSAWKAAGLNKDISATMMRKAAVTKAFEEGGTNMEALAKHMGHRVDTQRTWYDRRQKDKIAVETVKNLERMRKKELGLKEKGKKAKGKRKAYVIESESEREDESNEESGEESGKKEEATKESGGRRERETEEGEKEKQETRRDGEGTNGKDKEDEEREKDKENEKGLQNEGEEKEEEEVAGNILLGDPWIYAVEEGREGKEKDGDQTGEEGKEKEKEKEKGKELDLENSQSESSSFLFNPGFVSQKFYKKNTKTKSRSLKTLHSGSSNYDSVDHDLMKELFHENFRQHVSPTTKLIVDTLELYPSAKEKLLSKGSVEQLRLRMVHLIRNKKVAI